MLMWWLRTACSFGQHNIQNLTAGLGAGVILPGGGFGFVQALLQRGVGGHAAQISDLNFQLMAFALMICTFRLAT